MWQAAQGSEQAPIHRDQIQRLVVFVDDDESLLAAVRRSFARHVRDIEVVALPNAERALDYVPLHRVDLIVMDHYMPGMCGVDACRRLRTTGFASPIAITSGRMTMALEREAFGAGANFTLEKPFDLHALIDTPIGQRPGCNEIDRRRQLVADHIAMARNVARGLARRYASLMAAEDFDGLAMVGLCEAAARFDPARPEPFIAFAEQRIRGAILDEVRRHGTHGRVVYKRQRKISGARRALTQTGHDPSDDRVAEHLGLTLSTVQDAGDRHHLTDDDVTALECPNATADALIEQDEVLRYLLRARAVLPEAEATIIRLRYDDGLSLVHVARTLQLPLARVTRLHARGIARLRSAMRDGGDLVSCVR